jgi:DNA helicase II / ATP-dependent DNA helicase PcrA
MNAPIFIPSAQQAAFLSWCQNGSGSCVLEAVAGAGKTTTLLQAIPLLAGQVAVMAYNKKIADEIAGKLTARGIDWQKAQAGTVHSFGFKALRKALPGVKVEGSKVSDIVDAMKASIPSAIDAKALCKVVSLAKQVGVGISSDARDIAVWAAIIDHHDIDLGEAELSAFAAAASRALTISNAQRDVVDFDDMVYLPLLMRLRFWQFDVVMVDEAQDTNATRRMLARAMLKPRGRLIAVGDRAQAIYGFTGADNDSLDLIRAEFNAIDLPLTTTYRCPKAVVAFAQQWVSHIEAADSAPQGEVSSMSMEAFMEAPASIPGLQQAAILCRNTKPLVSLAMQLIRRKVACKVEGRDVAEQLKKLVRRWKVQYSAQLVERLEAYRVREIEKAKASKKDAKIEVINDTVDTILVIVDECNANGQKLVEDVAAQIDALFGDSVSSMLVLSTIHKSKGREWNDVYWLDRAGLCPSKFARLDWQKQQEANLQYVAATRAQKRLIDLSV